jgi:hypothetical protein
MAAEPLADFDWYKCKFLESAENLKPLVHMRVGRTPSTAIAREIAACLQQGRLFYEAAVNSPLEIKPLQLFYGMVGFSKALITAYRVRSLATLPHAHGLSDISQTNSRIADLRVKIDRFGTFQEVNDVLAELNRLCYFDQATNPRVIKLPSAKSSDLIGLEMSLKEILSRVPQLESLFQITFGETPNTGQLDLNMSGGDGYWNLSVREQATFGDRDSLKTIVGRLRTLYPFLNDWCFVSAVRSWGQTIIEFGNVSNSGIDEFDEKYLRSDGESYQARSHPERDSGRKRFPPASQLPPLATGFSGQYTYTIAPIRTIYPSEFALQYAAMFLLSSLVRYRPQNWVHAISRTGFSDAPTDDQCLALIERFLEINSSAMPALVVAALNPHEDSYA